MTMKVTTFFSKDDQERISAAVREAESRTAGEIVPYVVAQSDPYEIAEWRASVLFGLVAFIAVTALRSVTAAWIPLDVLEIAVATLAAAACGMLLARFVPVAKRFFAGRFLIDRRTEQRAAEAFLSTEVFQTRDRTGILIFLSLLERRVLVLGDSGINAKVRQEDWHDIVGRVVEGIRRGKPADGLVDAIVRSGILLEQHGVRRRADDQDELPDTLRMDKD